MGTCGKGGVLFSLAGLRALLTVFLSFTSVFLLNVMATFVRPVFFNLFFIITPTPHRAFLDILFLISTSP